MRRYLLPVLLLLATGCSRDQPSQADVARAAQINDWRLLISLPAVELPVQLQLSEDQSRAWLINGDERVRVPEVRRDGAVWRLHFPAFNNTLEFEQNGERLSGSLTLVKRGYEQVMDLRGEPQSGYRFVRDPAPRVDVTGRWEVEFTEDGGKQSQAVAEFDQQGANLSGTFLTPLGDYRYLAGEVDGLQVWLSTFDGAHAFVFSATVQPDGSLAGDFWSGTKWHESWVARRNFDAQLPDAFALTWLKAGYNRFEFSFPDLQGNAVSLQDAKFTDKVVLVSLAGSWCPNCADEMAFLGAEYKKHHNRGLEIITLLFEHFDDFETAAAQGQAMVAELDLGFDVLVAGSSDKAQASEALPMLNRVLAFPTLIFVGRDGVVRRIHTGFSGPGTGQHYEDFKKEFARILEELLAEQGAPAT